MDCPRCKLTMQPAKYEEQDVTFCSNCWGYWLTRAHLDAIVKNAEYAFNKDEQESVEKTLSTQGDADRGDEKAMIQCPECTKFMEKKLYHEKCPVEIDECAEHGVWLDTGEIKELQVYIESHLGG